MSTANLPLVGGTSSAPLWHRCEIMEIRRAPVVTPSSICDSLPYRMGRQKTIFQVSRLGGFAPGQTVRTVSHPSRAGRSANSFSVSAPSALACQTSLYLRSSRIVPNGNGYADAMPGDRSSCQSILSPVSRCLNAVLVRRTCTLDSASQSLTFSSTSAASVPRKVLTFITGLSRKKAPTRREATPGPKVAGTTGERACTRPRQH